MNIENGFPGLDEIKLDELESQLGFQLPLSYKNFLKKFNGGIPSNGGTSDLNVWCINVLGFPGNSTDVQVFFGFNKAVASSNILWRFSFIHETLPDNNLLPFACDSGGSLFCFQLSNEAQEPKIVYWDFSAEEGEWPIYPVAENFNHFLSSMYEYHDDD
jgi:hypothetical protein